MLSEPEETEQEEGNSKQEADNFSGLAITILDSSSDEGEKEGVYARAQNHTNTREHITHTTHARAFRAVSRNCPRRGGMCDVSQNGCRDARVPRLRAICSRQYHGMFRFPAVVSFGNVCYVREV